MARRQVRMPGLFPDERTDALSIGALFAQLHAAVAGAFPRGRGIWVRGEIQSIAEHRSGHCYIDLVDPDSGSFRDRPVLKVNCWRTTWGPLRAVLAGQGITLATGMVVTLQGRVELYAPRSQVGFVASDIDVASLLGRIAAQRAALLAALEAEGLLRRNAACPVPAVPLRIGLVASPRTEGCNDFLSQLQGSGLGFHVRLVPVHVQGHGAPKAIARALELLGRAGCDITVLVRGGGAKADLVAFDTEPVARAVAIHPAAVWTGIGHTGDQSVADVVANRSFVTPTECGQELVKQVRDWWVTTVGSAELVARRCRDAMAQAQTRDSQARHRLGRATRHQLDRHTERLVARGERVALQARRQLERSTESLEYRAAKLGPRATAVLDRASERSTAWRRLLSAYDVDRQLERGYTLTLDHQGRIVRSVASLSTGHVLVTRFADGTARSTVASTQGVVHETSEGNA
ncbi:MAG TPA: exodeoxyribonuclease VII large subunit [Acidimicrobiales bacterium]|nr:exodeoxyribonuclease VII large subunit [Acidimicrobiales bacterium]